ncbi:hypothetical protein [Weissella halotolerans]|uniref:Uncharacterized protein n=1 Tax=Weissella halotolerans DSM 20190 TaxID=1123500 RepID=A0A0R2FQJ3_9LACO|nr:hypothetical protein [Weissella halotolerans]KRN30793.1 hypothetical protein IV68_GL001220 [Weissella halotolerans DSM 20190]
MTVQTKSQQKAGLTAKPKRVQYYGQVAGQTQLQQVRSLFVRDHVGFEELVALGQLFEALGQEQKISHILVTEQKVWPMPN